MRTTDARAARLPYEVAPVSAPRLGRPWRRITVGVGVLALSVGMLEIGARWVQYRFGHVVSSDASLRGFVTKVGARINGQVTAIAVEGCQHVSKGDILARLAAHYGSISAVHSDNATAPAERFRLPDGTTFGIVASTTAPFCRSCDRSRLTADGTWFLCLYAAQGIDLREPLRNGASDAQLTELIAATWRGRTDRGAEERLEVAERTPLYQVDGLRADPHREMHTRGG